VKIDTNKDEMIMSEIINRLDNISTNMFNENRIFELDTVKDAKEYIEKLENIFNFFDLTSPEYSGHYFISGELGNKDNNGLPDRIKICPSQGCDFSVIYEKTDTTMGGIEL